MRTTADVRSSNGCAHHSGCGTLVGVPLRAAIPDLGRSLLVTCFLRVRYGIIGVALIAMAVTLAACGSDPTPTPTPTPGAWVGRSTPTRTPTPTPGPLVGMADFTVDESTTGGELIAVLTEEEVSCIRTTLGEDGYATFLRAPALQFDSPELGFPGACLSAESTATVVSAVMDADAGGLSAESRTCLHHAVAARDPALFWGDDPEGQSSGSFSAAFFIDSLLCMTDEEAARRDENIGGESFIAPSDLRCIVDAAGKEQIVALFDAMSSSAEESFPFDLLAELVPALQSCSVDLVEQTPEY